jgi:malonyl-CoA O-methyltransferase
VHNTLNEKTCLTFSKYAHQYNHYNLIQKQVLERLLDQLEPLFEKSSNNLSILDIGCGSGQVYTALSQRGWNCKSFIALDFSEAMCNLHPKASEVKVIQQDFDSMDLEELLKLTPDNKFDLIISSSALQWSSNIDKLLQKLAQIPTFLALNIFTADTFKTLWQTNQKTSPIYPKEVLIPSLNCYLDNIMIETLSYTLEFENKKTLFDYIKNSGVGTTKEPLTYKESKHLYQHYPISYLEFEILQIVTKM